MTAARPDSRPGPHHPFLDHDGPIAFAHRGGAAEAPENTLAAFAHAVELGYRYVELDVRATRDGKVVVFHDATLDRVTDTRGRVGSRTWRQLRSVRVHGTEPVALLDDVLDAWPDLRVNIDPKSDAVVAPLVSLLRRRPADLERVCAMAFSDRRLRRLRRALGPRLCTALGPAAMARLRLAASGLGAGRPTGHVAQVPSDLYGLRLLDPAVVRTCRRLDLPIHVWVVDEPGEMDRLLELGAHGIMTDRPTTLRAVLRARGAWSPA